MQEDFVLASEKYNMISLPLFTNYSIASFSNSFVSFSLSFFFSMAFITPPINDNGVKNFLKIQTILIYVFSALRLIQFLFYNVS